MRITPFMNKIFVGLSAFNVVACVYLYVVDPSVQPGMLNYRFGNGLVTVWFMTLSIAARSIKYAVFSGIFALLAVLSFFDVSSYLFLATTNAALAYLMLTNEHVKS
jgi:hypothetical protein